MTAPDPLREDEVMQVGEAIIMAQPAHHARDWQLNPIYEAERLAGATLARAAILRLDQVRGK